MCWVFFSIFFFLHVVFVSRRFVHCGDVSYRSWRKHFGFVSACLRLYPLLVFVLLEGLLGLVLALGLVEIE